MSMMQHAPYLDPCNLWHQQCTCLLAASARICTPYTPVSPSCILHRRAVFAFRARDATQSALDAAGIQLEWWGAQAGILLATAVCFPLFALTAMGVRCVRHTRCVLCIVL
jgi:hypothetical protein